jgi:hypothetical protein
MPDRQRIVATTQSFVVIAKTDDNPSQDDGLPLHPFQHLVDY